MQQPETPTDTAPPQVFGSREQLAIWLMLVSAFTVILNETVMSVALPRLMADLNITASQGQWLTTAFLLTMSVVIPVTGMLIQRYSTRAMFIGAMGLFSLGTLVAATAPTFEVLLLARVIQASGTAIMMPLLMTTVATVVPAHQRGQLMGRISIVISVAPALGPTVSGIILKWMSWHFIFLFVLPIALVALVVGIARMPNVGIRRKTRIDVTSVVLSVIGFGGLVYGLSTAGESTSGTFALLVTLSPVIGLVSLVAFVLRQIHLQKENRALLDLRTFRSRPFALSVVVFSFASVALFGSLILLPIFVQDVLGYETLGSGLVLLPGGLIMGLLGPIVGRIVDRKGARVMLVPGTVLAATALFGMSMLNESSTIWHVLIAHIVLSLGLAGIYTPLFTVALGSLPGQLASYGSATISTAQQVAGAAGTAAFVSILTLVSSTATANSGVSEAAALAAGTSAAFFVGGVIASLGAVLSFFVVEQRTDEEGQATSIARRSASAS